MVYFNESVNCFGSMEEFLFQPGCEEFQEQFPQAISIDNNTIYSMNNI